MPIDSLEHIRSHYRALNTGDVGLIASHFAADAHRIAADDEAVNERNPRGDLEGDP